MSEFDTKTKEMIAMSASIAGNCKPCLKYHFKEAGIKKNLRNFKYGQTKTH